MDPDLVLLTSLVQQALTEEGGELPQGLRQFHQHREHLSIVDGVVIYKKRTVVPATLRSEVLEALHSAHQGCTGMQARADAALFWPGISADITRARARCVS